MNIKNLHHVCIQTNNYKASINFYVNILGFEIIKESKGFHTRDYNTWIKLGSTMIELQTPKPNRPLKHWHSDNAGPVHLGFIVDNVKDAYEYILSKGHTSFKSKDGDHVYKVENTFLCKVKAPEGTEIELRDSIEL